MTLTNAQSNRVGRLFTPLAADTLVLLEFSGTESTNDVSMFRVKALSQTNPVDLDKLLGKPMVLEFDLPDGEVRTFHLIVFGARYLGQTSLDHYYDFELRPWIWAMSRRETSRIFHKSTIKDIITKVVNEYAGLEGMAFKFDVQTSLPEMEYVVQYGESDLTFVRRLLEEYGINFYMKMEKERETLVMFEKFDNFEPLGDRAFVPITSSHNAASEHFDVWLPQRQLTTGKVRMVDYDFKKPRTALDTNFGNTLDYANSGYEVYEYPGRFDTASVGTNLATHRQQALRGPDATVRANGDLMSLGPGYKMTLSEHPEAAEKGEYACLSANHHYSDGGYRSGGTHSTTYHGHYHLTRSSHMLAPDRVTPRPIMRGPQTARVVDGADGNVDKYGRIIVSFHWDTAAKSMPCRVSQMWSGRSWGTVFIPRNGMEVIVEFLDGDVDRPIIVGCVYNADNMPPWSLPDEKLKSGIKTNSSAGYNELSFNDKSGAELIEMHGQKDLKVVIENNEDHEIKKESTRKIGGNRKDDISGNRTDTIGGNLKRTVTGNIDIISHGTITLKTAGCSIEMTATAITLKAPTITVDAMMSLSTKGGANAEHSAGIDMAIKAALVRINS